MGRVQTGEDKSKAADDSTKSEDTSTEEEDTSTNNSSNENDGEENSDSGEESEESDSDNVEDITKAALSDPSKLPANLRPFAKKLQAIFTKKMQEASQYKIKAGGLDKLAADPRFQKWYREEILNLGGGNKKSSRSKEDNNSDDDEDDDTPAWAKKFQAKVESIESRLNQKDQELFAKEDKIEADAFRKKNPDWKLYKDKMAELQEENPKLSYQKLYLLAKDELGELEEEEDSEEEVKNKKKTNSMKPSKSAGADGKGSQKPAKKGVMGAYELAKQMLAGGKIKGR